MARSGGSTVIAKGSAFVAPLEERHEYITTRTPNFGILTSIAANSGSTIRLDGSFHKEVGKTDQELARAQQGQWLREPEPVMAIG